MATLFQNRGLAMSNEKSRSNPGVVFRCLDRNADVEKTERNLPHWFQVGAAIFVTFRTADSMPHDVVERFHSELKHWLAKNGLPLELAERDTNGLACPREKLAEFKKLRARAWHRSLDECHGECHLRQPKLARIVADAIFYHDSTKYDLDCFVVMPNHVHAIVQFRPGNSLKVISQSWMRYSARQINFETGDTGQFWQSEPFDHIIRSPEQFAYLQKYIADNPKKAKLTNGEFLYWHR